MGVIVCAIRGGDGSRRAQERAITLATERDNSIIFVHVIDMDFVNRINPSLSDSLIQELTAIGNSLLSIAAERAAAHHIEAQTVILQGTIPEALENYVKTLLSAMLVMGTPSREAEPDTFDSDSLSSFVGRLRADLGIEVEVV